MGPTEQESHLESKGKKVFIPVDLIQHIFQTVMGLFNDEQLENLYHWIQFRGYETFDDMYDGFHHNPEDVQKYEDFKWNGVKDYIGPNIVQKVKKLHQMDELKKGLSILYDHFLFYLKREDYIEFREMDIEPMPNIRSYHTEPTKPMTTFYGHTKPTTITESQTALNNFKKGTKRDVSAYPIFKNNLYYDTFQRSFMAVIKAQGLYDVVDPDYDPDDADQYEKELFQEKQYFVYYVLVTSLQTERDWSKNLKEMQDPSFQNCTITTLNQMLHNMKVCN